MATLQQRADAVLDLKRKRRIEHACYPCSKRKVKCEGGQPCEQCRKRKHPDICFYDDDGRQSARRRKHRKITDEIPSPSETITGDATSRSSNPSDRPTVPLSVHSDQRSFVANQNELRNSRSIGELTDSAGDWQEPQPVSKTQIGRYSLGALLQQRLHAVSIDVRSSFGLINDSALEPVSSPFTLTADGGDLLRLCVTRAEVLELFPSFLQIAPFYAILDDPAAFQVVILDLLDRLDRLNSSEVRSFLRASSAKLALCLIALALGAQFSHLPRSERFLYGQDFAQRSEAFLRLSNYIVKPSVETVQTLLYTGIYMQNIGQSDGSWSLLGLTLRIAQSMGLCKDDSRGERSLWNHVLWQDSLLSLRFDRLPMRSGSALIFGAGDSEFLEADDYATTMLRMNHITLSFLSTPRLERIKQSTMVERVEQIRQVLAGTASYLQNQKWCKTLQQRLENFALRTHSSFLTAEICRPNLLLIPQDSHTISEESQWLHKTCIERMQDVVQAYLDMSKISSLPLRSWSLIHEALTCACVLALLQAASVAASLVNETLDKIQQLLENELQPSNDDGPQLGAGVISRGLKLLKFLREHGVDIMRTGTASQQDTIVDSHMATAGADAHSGLDETWWEPFFLDNGLDSSLSSFLDLSFEFHQ